MPRTPGIVKWFNVSIGYGFIMSDDGSELFVHGNSCERGFLVNGERVLFEVCDCAVGGKGKTRGRQAVRVRTRPVEVVPAASAERLLVTTQSIVC